METRHGRRAAHLRLVVDKGTVAFGYEENAFDVFCCVSGEVIFQIYNVRSRWKIANP